MRKVGIPPHRLTPLKKDWLKIYTPLVEHMKCQVRMNLKSKCVEIRVIEFFFKNEEIYNNLVV